MKRSAKKNKGITLIALVITIIVLLILAGVTIASLSGDNGILTRATEGKEKTNKANFDEKVTIASTELKMGYETNTPVANPKTFLEGKFEEVIDNGDNSYTVKDNPHEAIIDVEGNKIIPVEVGKVSIETQKNNYKDSDGKKATIPQGFTVVPGCEKISEGLVISDDPSDTEANTEKIANGAQFVWIPVDNPSEMFGTDGEGNCGKLYSFPVDSDSLIIEPRPTDCGEREPDIVSYSDNDNYAKINAILGENYYKDVNAFKKGLQADFNKMKSSVERYGGFYIGRYESSLIGNDNNAYLAPKKGVKSATADEEKNQTWYGLYARQKLYKKNNIEGSMIWGCQYDAMIIWLQRNGIDVIKDIGEKRNKGKDQLGNEVGTTGTIETDKLKNIYDLYGNSHEFTLATAGGNRTYRGGYCITNWYSPSHRGFCRPTVTDYYYSTRATLYIP